MKKTYFTCGPSQLFPTVIKHLRTALKEDVASISHRSQKFEEIYKKTQLSLRKLLEVPGSFHIFFLSSSLEIMERIIENTVEKQSTHFVNGSFSQKWQEAASEEHKKPARYFAEWGSAFDAGKIRQNRKTELICITQNETSTGVATPIASINRLDDIYPDSLIAVDMVSSAPYAKLDFDRIDMAFFSVQKGFGLPAGLSVLLANEKSVKKSLVLFQKGKIGETYHSFISLAKKDGIFQTPETPNVLGIYLLGRVAEDMLKIGIKKIRRDTEIKAKLIYDFLDNHPKYEAAVRERELRSKTTIDIVVGRDKNRLMKKLAQKKLIVGSGYGKFKESHIRIANFPAHSLSDIKKLLANIE